MMKYMLQFVFLVYFQVSVRRMLIFVWKKPGGIVITVWGQGIKHHPVVSDGSQCPGKVWFDDLARV